jgi:hypothetical protein
MAGTRDLIKHAGSKDAPPFKIVRYGTSERVNHVDSVGDGQYKLDAAITVADMEIRYTDGFNWIKRNVILFPRQGTREEVIDQCLKEWSPQPAEPSWGACWAQILTQVAGESHGKTYDEWMKWRGKPPTTRASTRQTSP